MSNIRPIGDPAIATAMLATMQSIDAVRSAPAGISEPRWRILRCIAKAAPNLPSPGELRMCSGLNKAALAEHVQALQWKGLLEMGGYRLSPSAAAMVGLEQAYPPKDAKGMQFAVIDPVPTTSPAKHGGTRLMQFANVPAEAELPLADIGQLSASPIAAKPPMDPADVPACMRPDCMPPAQPIPEVNREEAADRPKQVASTDGPRGRVSAGHGASGEDDAGAVYTADDAAPQEVANMAGVAQW